MWQRWVSRSSSAVVIFGSPNTVAHSPKLRLVVMMTLGALVELAQQMEEQSSSGGAERQVAEFVKNDEVGIGEAPRNLAGLPLVLFLFESVDEFDRGEEPN